MRADFEAIGQPLQKAQQLAAELWTRDLANRLRRYLKGSGQHAGRVTS